MSRRLFLERMAGLIGLGIAAPQTRASQGHATQAPINAAPVMGARHTAAQAAHATAQATPPAAQATPEVSAATPVAQTRAAAAQRVTLQRSPVAGFQYHQGEAVWPLLHVGAPLRLVRERDNAYDTRAVRVDWQGLKLGYVPRIDNAAVSHLLDAGQTLQARITRLQVSSDPWERVEFEVVLLAGQEGRHG